MQTQSKIENPKSKIASLAIALFVLLLSWPCFVKAQQPAKVPRIGYVSATGSANNPGHQIEAFRQGLRDLGYIDGKNVLVEYRYLEGSWTISPASWLN